MRTFVFCLLILSGCAHDRGAGETATDLDKDWMGLIQTKFAPSCRVTLKKVGFVVAAVNGYRDEQWFVETCKGDYEYRVEYYPQEFFPDRATPYEIIQVSPSGNGDGA